MSVFVWHISGDEPAKTSRWRRGAQRSLGTRLCLRTPWALRVLESLPVVFSGKESILHSYRGTWALHCLVLNLAASSLGPAPRWRGPAARRGEMEALFGKIGKLCNADAEWALAVRPSDPPTRSP
jgi:hypothetical protein